MSETSPAEPARRWWRLPVELRVLVGLLVVVGGTWLFVELAGAVTEGSTREFDNRILRSLRAPSDPPQVVAPAPAGRPEAAQQTDDRSQTVGPSTETRPREALSAGDTSRIIGPAWVAEMARDLTALGGYTVLFLVTTAVAVFLGMSGNHVALRFVLFAIGSGWLVSMGLKALFERPRPTVVEHLSQAFTSSFPSGHSMMSAVVYLTLGALLARFATTTALRMYFLSVAILLTFLVGCSRVFMGVHYPTDVLAGWTAGLVWATFCWLVTRRWQRRHPAEAKRSEVTP